MSRKRNPMLWLVACCATLLMLAADASAQERRRAEAGRPDGRSQTWHSGAEQWTNKLVDELDHLEEDLYYERTERGLIKEVESTLNAVVHFRRVLRGGADRDHLIRDFREMDKQVHDLLEELSDSRSSWLRRATSRIRYADEQIHYYLAVPDRDDQETFRELVARHAHVLEQQSERLEGISRRFPNPPGRPNSLHEAIRDFADEAEHFHKVVEEGADRAHLQRDFRELDQSWHNAVDQINRSSQGLWVRRQAQLVNKVHNQLHELLDLKDDARRQQPPQKDDHESRPRIEFELPGIGRFRLGD